MSARQTCREVLAGPDGLRVLCGRQTALQDDGTWGHKGRAHGRGSIQWTDPVDLDELDEHGADQVRDVVVGLVAAEQHVARLREGAEFTPCAGCPRPMQDTCWAEKACIGWPS